MRPVSTSQSILINAPRQRVFSTAAGMPPSDLIKPSLILPGIETMETPPPPWQGVGDTRHHDLTDGTSVDEEITAFAQDEYYAYRITGFEGPFGKLVSEGVGEWTFDWRGPEATHVTWDYRFTPKSSSVRPFVAAIVAALWPGYLKGALKRVKTHSEETTT